MHRTPMQLADGRELIYYDSAPGRGTPSPDRRRLEAIAARSRVRRDPLLGTWTIVAEHRQDRTHLPAADECPLCPSREGHPTEIPDPDYEVVVFENRFPALRGYLEARGSRNGLHEDEPGNGRCEVICFTSEHHGSFAALTHDRARLVVDAWADRTQELSALPGVQQVFCFENRGEEIGVTEPHPHGQIYAYPFTTPRSAAMLGRIAQHGNSLWEDLIAAETAGGRVVVEGNAWLAFVPFAARWPYEVHLYPRRHVPDLCSLDEDERNEMVEVYLDLLGRFDRLFGRPAPYVSAWHQAPKESGGSLRLHLELFTSRRGPDKLKYLAGSEAAMDVYVGDIVPEEAAERLRALA